MFPKDITAEQINLFSPNTLVSLLDINITEIGDDFIKATMPINEKTHQYMGILHGGASVVLAETIGSIGSYLLIDRETQYTVGLEVNANHVGSAREGMATAKARIIHKGKKTHVWSIEISDDNNKLLSICRLTTMIITK